MDEEDRDALIEELASAWRPLSEGGPSAHPAWEKLDEEGRLEAFEIAKSLRLMEAAFDSEGLSTTGKVVMDRVAREQRASDTEPARTAKVIAFPRRFLQSQPLAMAAVAMLVVGIGLWASRDDEALGGSPTDEERVAAIDEPTHERELTEPAPEELAEPSHTPEEKVEREALAAAEPPARVAGSA